MVKEMKAEETRQFQKRNAAGANGETKEQKQDESDDDDDEEDVDEDDEGMDDDGASVATGSTTDGAGGGAGSTTPGEVGLSAADLTVVCRALGLLQSHPGLLRHSSLRPVRTALAPLVERLAGEWQVGRVATATLRKRALKRSFKEVLTGKAAAQREYEAALDSAARNATGMRAARLQKLESLNSLLDGEAQDEEALARRAALAAYRVPDGVAITDGHSNDVCMQLLTDGSGGADGRANKRQKLLTGGAAAIMPPAAAAASTTVAAASSSAGVGAATAASAAGSTAAAAAAAAPTKLVNPIKCYICKAMFKDLHHFYDSLCPACAKLNFTKRGLSADLTGKIVLLTGARVKIGYRILVKLLRCGAFVVATTRFPHDLSVRLQLEHDHAAWRSRVHIYGLDFRNLTVLEEFVALMYKKYTHLDAIINNACQTVRRPPQVRHKHDTQHNARQARMDGAAWIHCCH